jgi:hypothetical protein
MKASREKPVPYSPPLNVLLLFLALLLAVDGLAHWKLKGAPQNPAAWLM